MIEQPTTEDLIARLAHSAGGETGVCLSTTTELQAAQRLREQVDELERLRTEVEALRAENRELIGSPEAFDEASVSGVHTCSTHCRRPNCVLRREAEALRAVLIEAVERYGQPGGPWNVPSDPGGWIYRAKNTLAGLHETRTPIADLVARYESEDCDFSDMDWVRSAALRYVETMPDSQVRCLLYALASSADAEARIAAAVAAERERCAAICDALEDATTSAREALIARSLASKIREPKS